MSESLKCIIVEDEVMARKSLERLCDKKTSLQLQGSFEHAEAAIDFLKDQKTDLIFLDVQLPGMSGLDFIEELSVLPQIVFTTSSEDYAYKAFEYEVTDYLKKPISLDRFSRAVKKCLQEADRKQEQADLSKASEIYVRVNKKLVRVPFTDILYFENAGDYISMVTRSGKYLIYGTIKSLAQRLNHPRLIKVHRSFIINLDYIKDIDDTSLVIDEKMIPISRAHRSVLLSTINIL